MAEQKFMRKACSDFGGRITILLFPGSKRRRMNALRTIAAAQ